MSLDVRCGRPGKLASLYLMLTFYNSYSNINPWIWKTNFKRMMTKILSTPVQNFLQPWLQIKYSR